MLQWLPGSKETVVWNDREGGEYVCRILNVRTKELRTIPHPIYALSPDGKTAIATDFRRLGHCRPGYGYNGISDPNEKIALPKDTGIFRIDLATGRQELILTIADVAKFGPQLPSMQGSGKHWFNHLLFNPEGTRFVFLHRWQTGPEKRETRMITANSDGSDLHVLDANGITSHFIWRDPEHILAFSRQPVHGNRFYLFDDKGRDIFSRVVYGTRVREGLGSSTLATMKFNSSAKPTMLTIACVRNAPPSFSRACIMCARSLPCVLATLSRELATPKNMTPTIMATTPVGKFRSRSGFAMNPHPLIVVSAPMMIETMAHMRARLAVFVRTEFSYSLNS